MIDFFSKQKGMKTCAAVWTSNKFGKVKIKLVRNLARQDFIHVSGFSPLTGNEIQTSLDEIFHLRLSDEILLRKVAVESLFKPNIPQKNL